MASDWDYGLEKDYDHKMEMMIKTNRSKYICRMILSCLLLFCYVLLSLAIL